MTEAKDIQLLGLDVDGVLTDGGIYVTDTGLEFKRFHVHDGFAVKAAQRVGLKVAAISGRSTPAVNLRLKALEIAEVVQGCRDKAAAIRAICARLDVPLSATAFLGDDLVDLPALRSVGYPMAVANGVAEVRQGARYVTTAPGGQGAAREAIEHILRARGLWAKVVERYDAELSS